MAFERYVPSYRYLGPNSWPLFVRKLLPYNRRFNVAAYVHDKFFSLGGSIDDFERANRIFVTMCYAVSETATQRFFARAYHYSVTKFGRFYFKFKMSLKIDRKAVLSQKLSEG